MRTMIISVALVMGVFSSAVVRGQEVGFPDGYRTWYHHHTTVNQEGHAPEGNVGIQHVYANELAVEGLKTGTYRDGSMFVVDRFKIAPGDNSTLNQGDRKVVAVMLRSAAKNADTGGWAFAAFKGGDPGMQVVKDAKACFACHVPHADNNFLFTRGPR